jgi:glycosyltransferase involved in cell wall biosynthesis
MKEILSMAAIVKANRIVFLSTYPPRECGLATFTEDLVKEINNLSLVQVSVIAVSNRESYTDSPVKYQLRQHERNSYLQTAQWANEHADLLIIEHEYGIYGGNCGEYILDLAKALKIPFIVTTHTVLLEPSAQQQSILRQLGSLSTKVVTMAESSISILVEIYGITAEKIMFIAHGVPPLSLKSREKLKAHYGLQNKQVISSFGLISPAKGLEYGIEAVANVAADYADLVYLILGKTHPCVKERMGESYRQSLIDLAERLGVKQHILFIDKYLTKEEVMTYLQLSDMYLTPYLSKEQAVSGTLAYAMGAGRVIISTPYRYAQEMLGGGRGLLAEFRDAKSIASCIRMVLSHPLRKQEMERKTVAVGKTMTWTNVAKRYVQLCTQLIADQAEQPCIVRELLTPVVHPSAPISLPVVRHNGFSLS